ncbi:hypothetical protein HYU14_03400 [Candidatus Woesearchaeota archaeon]|nr:hypothetical protein [Candidatus Woesearchaeota archaeon]
MNKKNFYLAMPAALFLIVILVAGCSEPDILDMNLNNYRSLAMHIHPNISIEILGEKITIPQNIGASREFMSVIHTHEANGVLHVESPKPHQFMLGDFFTIWGKPFNESCILDHCIDSNHTLKVLVNGKEAKTFRDTPLLENQHITILYSRMP